MTREELPIMEANPNLSEAPLPQRPQRTEVLVAEVLEVLFAAGLAQGSYVRTHRYNHVHAHMHIYMYMYIYYVVYIYVINKLFSLHVYYSGLL